MKTQHKDFIVIGVYCFWMGILIAISFLETPLKFQVPGITLPFALELGKLMFGVSINIQLLLAVLLMMLFFRNINFIKRDFIFLGFLLILLMLEKLWILPVLDARADLISAGNPVPPSDLHNIFIGAEVLKLILLAIAILFQYRNATNLEKNL